MLKSVRALCEPALPARYWAAARVALRRSCHEPCERPPRHVRRSPRVEQTPPYTCRVLRAFYDAWRRNVSRGGSAVFISLVWLSPMGGIDVQIDLENTLDAGNAVAGLVKPEAGRRYALRALVDTGAVMIALPQEAVGH